MWWSEVFPGDLAQLGRVREWVRDLCLPEPDDIVLVASELAANTVRHTRSGADGGGFSVEVAHAGEWTRVVVGDQGNPSSVPHVVGGHGLFVVQGITRDWGTVGDQDARYVWADVPSPEGAAAGPTRAGRDEALLTDYLQLAFPRARVWWQPSARTWCARPGGRGSAGVTLSAPSPASLARMLAMWDVAGRTRPYGCTA